MTNSSGINPGLWEKEYAGGGKTESQRLARTRAASSGRLADLDLAKSQHDAARMVALEDRARDEVVVGEFEGSVTGYWEQLGDRGEGVVRYNGTTFATKPIGFVSLPKGTEVELSFAHGTYYSKF